MKQKEEENLKPRTKNSELEFINFESWLYELCYTITKKRKERGLSQEEFANRLGVNQSTIARIEAGQNITCRTLWKISNVLEEDLVVFGVSKNVEINEYQKFLNSSIWGKAFKKKSEFFLAIEKAEKYKKRGKMEFTNDLKKLRKKL